MKECERLWPHGIMSEHSATVSLREGCFSPRLINLTTAMGGGREHFDELLAQIPQIEFRRYHFNNSNRATHYNYGVEYNQNDLVLKNPSYLDSYEPYTSCASAQLIIKKVKK